MIKKHTFHSYVYLRKIKTFKSESFQSGQVKDLKIGTCCFPG